MTDVAEVLYLAKNPTTGCWEHGSARRTEGRVDVQYSKLERDAFSADPEQLFAAGWTASFDGTMAFAAFKVKVVLSRCAAIDATVDLYLVDGEYFLKARLNASLADMPPEIAYILGSVAEQGGSRSKPIRGGIEVIVDMN